MTVRLFILTRSRQLTHLIQVSLGLIQQGITIRQQRHIALERLLHRSDALLNRLELLFPI